MIFLGVYPDGGALKMAKIRREKRKNFIEILRTIPISSSGEFVNPLYNMEEVLGGSPRIVTCIPAQDIFIRTVESKLTEKGKILSTLPFLVENVLPYPFEEAIITPFLEKEEKKQCSKIRLFSARQNSVQGHLDKMKALDIDPDSVTSTVNALIRYIHFFYGHNASMFFFHIGQEESVAIAMVEGKLEVSYPFDFTIAALKEAMKKDAPHLCDEENLEAMKSFDFTKLSPEETPHLFDLLFSFEKEICRILFSLSTRPFAKEIKNICLICSSPVSTKLKDFFLSCFPSDFLIMPSINFEKFDATTLESYAIPIGLALEGAQKDGMSLELRQKQFISERMVKRRIKKLSLLFTACLTLSGSVFFLLSAEIKRQEDELLTMCHQFFPDARGKDTEHIYREMQSKLMSDKKNVFLSTDARSVSEVLSYLTYHPHMQGNKNTFIPFDKIEITKVHYELIRPPRLTTRSAMEQVKVELELSCASSRAAREFHEALKKGDSFIDEKKEITWQVKDSIYKTSFYMKPKGERS